MVESAYNNRISLSDKIDVLYNSLTDKYLILNKNVDILNVVNPVLIDKLAKGGFVCSHRDIERKLAMKIRDKALGHSDTFQIIINPTLQCNFRCWYCYEEHNSSLQMKDEIIERIKLFIKNLVPDYKHIAISFFGGEPLLEWERIVKPLIDYCNSLAPDDPTKFIYSFTSNGYLLSDKIIEYLSSLHSVSFQITLDGDESFHNEVRRSTKNDSFRVITGNVEKLLRNSVDVLLRINVTSDNIHSISNLKSLLSSFSFNKKGKFKVSIHQVWQEKQDLSPDIDRLISDFLETGIDITTNFPDNLRSPCYGDISHSIVINYNGDLFKCTATDFSHIKRKGVLSDKGEIVEENNRLRKIKRIRMTNEKCLACRIFGLCNSGCYEKSTMLSNGRCIYGEDQHIFDTIVKRRIMYRLLVYKHTIKL